MYFLVAVAGVVVVGGGAVGDFVGDGGIAVVVVGGGKLL